MRRIPINLAMKLGDKTAKYRWFAVVYIITVFFLMPAVLLGISFLPPPTVFIVIGALVIFFGVIILINVLQVKCPDILPRVLKNWDFLPLWLRSLKPYDAVMVRTLSRIPGCRNRFDRTLSQKIETPYTRSRENSTIFPEQLNFIQH